jgi:hypothetical protein
MIPKAVVLIFGAFIMRIWFVLASCLFLFLPPTVNAQIQTIAVTSEGVSTTSESAINKALVAAITRVNGAEMASKATSSLSQNSTTVGAERQVSSSKSYQSDIRKRTKGVVQSFEILEKKPHRTRPNMVYVKLRVNVAKFKVSKQLARRRMTVLPFRVGRDVRNKRTGDKFQKSFSNGLEDYLTQTRRFAMLDRKFFREQNMELNFLKSGGVKTEEIARIGNRVGVDYLIVGEVVAAYSARKSMTMKATGQKIVSHNSVGKVVFRVIDVATTQIKFGDTKSINLENGSVQRSAVLLANKIGKLIINAIYPIRVVSVDRNSLTLGQGGNTVKEGGTYALIKYGNRIRDPYTKESLGRAEINVGKVRIETVQAKFSTAKILKLKNIKLSEINSSDYIVRPISGSRRNGAASNRKSTRQIEKESDNALKKFEKKSKDDW